VRSIDPSTGLPPLPEGQYWEVLLAHVDDDGYTYEIRIMERLATGRKVVASARFKPRRALESARVREEAEHLVVTTAAHDLVESLLGSYPPNRLVV
jgi:hypothetical protein